MSEINEAEILFPTRTITVNGEDITVHEFNYLQGLKAAVIAQPLLADLLRLIQDSDTMELPELDRVIGANAEAWIELLAMAADKDIPWVQALSDADGTLLSLTFWEINGPFLLRRVAFGKQFGKIILNQPPAES
jgi:hypothetical protein